MNFNPHRPVKGYHFPLNGDIYDTLNPALQNLQLIIFSEALPEHIQPVVVAVVSLNAF